MAFIGRVGMYVILATLGCGAWAQDYKPGEVIVKLKNKGAMSSYAFLGKAQTDKQMTLKESYGKMNMHHFALGKGTSVSQAIHDLSQDPDVEFVEPNYYLHKSDDTGIQERFSMAEIEEYAASSQEKILATDSNIGLDYAWQSLSGGGVGALAANPPVVAVIDTGLQIDHTVITDTSALWVNSGEIAGNGIDDDGNGYIDDVNGWNFVTNSGTIYDDDGHGTHVTGIILSVDQNIFTTPRTTAKI
ncbi:MAG TPA: hypothetical protein DCL41_01555, partial [Bdellovibrionales bacterium]|nr:hypothetical protein [Bdellovibrionales bacterium]